MTEPQDKMKGWKCYEAFDDVPIDLGYGMYDGRDFFCRRKYAPHDLSPEPIIPDVCSHLYSFKYATSVSETDPKTGRTYTVTTEYYVCTNCGAEYIVTTYK